MRSFRDMGRLVFWGRICDGRTVCGCVDVREGYFILKGSEKGMGVCQRVCVCDVCVAIF